MVTRNTPDEALENVETVVRVPRTVLPIGPARSVLTWLAMSGYDVYAYASGGETYGTWCAWLGPLADARRPERNGRVPLAEWCERWPALLEEMAVTLGNLEFLGEIEVTA